MHVKKPPLPKTGAAALANGKDNKESSEWASRAKQNQLNMVANLSQSLQMQILKCNSVIFGPQIKLE
jgi:hypothetical protein